MFKIFGGIGLALEQLAFHANVPNLSFEEIIVFNHSVGEFLHKDDVAFNLCLELIFSGTETAQGLLFLFEQDGLCPKFHFCHVVAG